MIDMTYADYLKEQQVYLDDLAQCRRRLHAEMQAQYDAAWAKEEAIDPRSKRPFEDFINRAIASGKRS
jgi:hypothetical protein